MAFNVTKSLTLGVIEVKGHGRYTRGRMSSLENIECFACRPEETRALVRRACVGRRGHLRGRVRRCRGPPRAEQQHVRAGLLHTRRRRHAPARAGQRAHQRLRAAGATNSRPAFLSNPYDRAAVVAAAKYIRKVTATPPLSDVWAAEYEPGPAVRTDTEWEEYARTAVASMDHTTGTCAMMASAEGGVVDAQLRVHGTRNLRVVDASIMPVQLSAQIQTAVYSIAERAAVLISKDWASAP